MGLKSGSRDAGLDDSSEKEEGRTQQEPADEATTQTTTEPEQTAESEPQTTSSSAGQADSQAKTQSQSGRPTMDSIPYKLRREKVNEGREQVPYFLREEVIEAETDLQDRLEEILDEKVYKSDYREAAMVVAQQNPDLIAEVLREWGYDLEER